MRRTMVVTAVVTLLGAVAASAWAEGPPPVGSVVAVTGVVEIGSAGAWQPAAAQQELFEGQSIRTGAGATVDVLFAPDAPVTLGERSEVAVADLLLKARLEQTRSRLTAPSDATRAEMQVTPLTGVRGTEKGEEKAGDLKREHYWNEGNAPAAK